MARAERFANADFAGALGDADQHDVHDHDAADHQRNAGDRHDDGGDHAEHLVDEAADGVRREHVEVIGLAGARVKAGAEHDAGFIERSGEIEAAAGLGPAEEREPGTGAVHAVEGGDRDVDRVVLVAAEGGAETLLHADDGELDALDADDLVERRGVAGEEGGAHGIADHGDDRRGSGPPGR